MPENTTTMLRSPLADALGPLTPVSGQASAGVRVAEWANVACLIVRGDAADAAFMKAVRGAAGVALPLQPSTMAAGPDGLVALWVSPDEWWLLLPRRSRDAVQAALREATAALHAQVADNTGGIALLRVAGPAHELLLRHLTLYDTAQLQIGRCVSTVLAKATMTVIRSDDAGVMLLFRRSFAGWIWSLVQRSARPYGLAICAPHQLPAPAFAGLLADPVRPTLVGALS